jgi:hypothetical protein
MDAQGSRSIFFAAPLFYAALFALTLAAFWPSYIAVAPSSLSSYHHLHAATSTAWLVLLIAQPMLVLSGRIATHRTVGKASYVLMPLVLLTFIGLAHSMMQGKSGTDLEIEVFLAYVRLVGGASVAIFYALAVIYRRNTPIHARLMLCTGLPLIEPVANRLGLRMLNDWSFNYQYISFGFMALVLLSCMWVERRSSSGRVVFPLVLVGLFAAYLPLLLQFYKWGTAYNIWTSLALWFASLPIP